MFVFVNGLFYSELDLVFLCFFDGIEGLNMDDILEDFDVFFLLLFECFDGILDDEDFLLLLLFLYGDCYFGVFFFLGNIELKFLVLFF